MTQPDQMHTVARLRQLEQQHDEGAIVAAKLLHLYEFASQQKGGRFLELGTDRGRATNVILEACRAIDGRLVSVDIRDCRNAASGAEWTFVQCSSIDKKSILAAATDLEGGIDLIYVDSKHTPEHVCAEINTWMPYLKIGGRMYFDDISSGPYMKGARKDNVKMEISNRKIFQVVLSYFQKNISSLRLQVMYGSTGLAWIEKRANLPENHALKLSDVMKERRFILPYKILKRLGLYSPYKHKRDGSDFLLK